MPVGRCCGCWSPACSCCCARVTCHSPDATAHCRWSSDRLLAPSAPFGGTQCQAAAASHIDPLVAIVGGSDLDEVDGSLLPSPMREEATTPLGPVDRCGGVVSR